MRLALLIAFGAALSAPLLAANGPAPRVSVATGIVEGTFPREGLGAVFKGIPYARPPVGPLRWRPPRRAERWDGVREASASGPACIQSGSAGLSGEEDCLYLNIWTPEWPIRSKRPVMLWLFGGANVVGSANNPVFDGTSLEARGRA